MLLLYRESQETMPPSLIVPAGVCLLGEAADFLRKGKIEPINNNVIAEAIQVFIEATIQALVETQIRCMPCLTNLRSKDKNHKHNNHKEEWHEYSRWINIICSQRLAGGAEAVSALGKAGVEKQIKIDLAKETADIEFEKINYLKNLILNYELRKQI